MKKVNRLANKTASSYCNSNIGPGPSKSVSREMISDKVNSTKTKKSLFTKKKKNDKHR